MPLSAAFRVVDATTAVQRLGHRPRKTPHQVVPFSWRKGGPYQVAQTPQSGPYQLAHDTEGFLNPLSDPLADLVAGMSGGPPIDRGPTVRRVLDDVRGEPSRPNIGDECFGVVVLVPSNGPSPFRCWEPVQHVFGAVTFGVAGCLG